MANIKHLQSQSIELLKLVFKELYKEYMTAYDIGSHVHTGRFNRYMKRDGKYKTFTVTEY